MDHSFAPQYSTYLSNFCDPLVSVDLFTWASILGGIFRKLQVGNSRAQVGQLVSLHLTSYKEICKCLLIWNAFLTSSQGLPISQLGSSQSLAPFSHVLLYRSIYETFVQSSMLVQRLFPLTSPFMPAILHSPSFNIFKCGAMQHPEFTQKGCESVKISPSCDYIQSLVCFQCTLNATSNVGLRWWRDVQMCNLRSRHKNQSPDDLN